MNANNNNDVLIDIVEKIKFLQEKYCGYFNEWEKLSNWNNVNFSKRTVKKIENDEALINKLIIYNNKILKKILDDNCDCFNKYFYAFRIKNINSIYKKIKTYCSKSTKGESPFIKCLNDFMGFRLIYKNLDLEHTAKFLENIFANENDKIKILLKNKQYKAIHVYVKINNYCLPWELQVWKEEDKQVNDNEHFKKYGRY